MVGSHRQNVKSVMMAHHNSNDNYLPTDIKDMRKVRREKMAFEFADNYIGGKVDSKKEYIKIKHVSKNTLDKALKEVGMMTSKRNVQRENKEGTKREQRGNVKGKQRSSKVFEGMKSVKGGNKMDTEGRVIVNERGETVSELADRCMRELERRH